MEKGHWYTDENGHHYFVKEGQSPKEGWEATKRRKMINGGKYQTSEDGKNWKDSSREEYEKYEADEMEFDENVDDDFGVDENNLDYRAEKIATDIREYVSDESLKTIKRYCNKYGVDYNKAIHELAKDIAAGALEESGESEVVETLLDNLVAGFDKKENPQSSELNSFLNKVKENKSNSDKVSVNGKMTPSDAQKMSANLEKELKQIFPGKIITVGYDIKGNNTTFDYKVNGLGGKSQQLEDENILQYSNDLEDLEGQFDVASPQEVANLMGKKVKTPEGDTFSPQKSDDKKFIPTKQTIWDDPNHPLYSISPSEQNEEFLTEAIKEMQKYSDEWKYYEKYRKNQISPEGKKELDKKLNRYKKALDYIRSGEEYGLSDKDEDLIINKLRDLDVKELNNPKGLRGILQETKINQLDDEQLRDLIAVAKYLKRIKK